MLETTSEKYCVFRQASDWYAFPALAVLEVAPAPEVISIPNSDQVLAGMCHLRNEFLPVLRLQTLAGEATAKAPGEQQLLVVHGTQGPWALLVDRVAGLETLEVSPSYETPIADDWAAAVAGSATLCSQLVRVLDARRVYCLADSILRQHWKKPLRNSSERNDFVARTSALTSGEPWTSLAGDRDN